MVATIGNPLTWAAQALNLGSSKLAPAIEELRGHDEATIELRKLTPADIRISLRQGLQDFMALRTDVLFIVLIYPVVGLLLAWFAFNRDYLHLLFPLASGFALLGPAAAMGLYEMSRRRELGQVPTWVDGFKILSTPSISAIVAMSCFLVGLFFAWMIFAQLLYGVTLGAMPELAATDLLSAVFTTGAGWAMLLIGGAIGFVFATIVLIVSVVSFPMLVDRHVGLPVAVATSIRVARKNPVAVAMWGGTVVLFLTLGVVTMFVGMIFVLPVLGHATWHFYRRAVRAPDRGDPASD